VARYLRWALPRNHQIHVARIRQIGLRTDVRRVTLKRVLFVISTMANLAKGCATSPCVLSPSIGSTARSASRRPWAHASLRHDVAVFQFLAMQCGVVIQILAQPGPFQSDARKQPLRSRPRQNGACICASVRAVAVRPTGLAATESSAPTLNWLDSSLSASRSVMTNMIKSVEEPPVW
jgi:hypothetical protein